MNQRALQRRNHNVLASLAGGEGDCARCCGVVHARSLGAICCGVVERYCLPTGSAQGGHEGHSPADFSCIANRDGRLYIVVSDGAARKS